MKRIRRRVIGGQYKSAKSKGSYAIDLNGQWQLSTTVPNPDPTMYEGVYESFKNRGKNYSADLMYIDIDGLTEFSFYVRSYAEATYDFVVVSNLDALKEIRVMLTGRDLIDLGFVPSPYFNKIFDKVLREKLEGKLVTKEDEIAFVKKFIKKGE